MITKENLKAGQIYQTERGTQFKITALHKNAVVNAEVVNGELKYELPETYDSFLNRLNKSNSFLVL